MNKTELKTYKALLGATQTDLAVRIKNRDRIAIEKSADELDRVQLAEERDIAIRNLDRESTLLRQVRSALARVTGGTYGTCLHCEGEISPKRLSVVPWSAYCLKCQEAADHDEFDAVEVRDTFFADAA